MTDTLKKTEKDPKVDFIRCTAFAFVICVHYFMYTGYYDIPISSMRMYAFTYLRSFFLVAVSMFILLTGYLMNRKELSLRYYRPLVKTLGIYVLASLACFAGEKLFWNPGISLLTTIRKIFRYEAAPYSWYIEMYIGLFLLIPFLNLIYNSLQTKKQKQWLIVTFFLLTSAPDLLNCFPLLTPGWFRPPVPAARNVQLLPDYWSALYPVTYYFIGCYIRQFQPRMKLWLHGALILLCNGLYTLFCIYRSYPNPFTDGSWNYYSSPFVVINAALVFSFLLNLPISFGKTGAKVLRTLSNCCLGAFLVSYIFDVLFYRWLGQITNNAPLHFRWILPSAIVIFICSMGLSFLLNQIYKICEVIISKATASFRHTAS